jgi:glycerate 2-kinase
MPDNRNQLNDMRHDAETIFNSALSAVNAFSAVKRHCRLKNGILYIGLSPFNLNRYKHIYIIGAGKASADMGAAMEEILTAKITGGIINVKYGHTVPLNRIKLIEAAHPIPDDNGCTGAKKILQLAKLAEKDDLIICLISGGGSALMPLPAPPLTLSDKQESIRILLACGATINEINALRKHMSLIKGGRLSETAWPATLVTLIVSDVVGNPLDVIASGPTVADATTFRDCMDIIDKYNIIDKLPMPVADYIQNGVNRHEPETPKPGLNIFDQTHNLIVASNIEALSAAKKSAALLGYNTLIISSMIEGDTRQAAHLHTAIAKEIRRTGNPIPPPACILSGGETTVVLSGTGKGGRNQEFALTAAIDIKEEKSMVLLSGGTDGTDGPTDAAGAIVDTSTIEKAKISGFDPAVFLKNNDSYHFFQKTGDLLKTGPTGTNVMDLRIVLVK